MAGRLATRETIAAVNKTWASTKPIYEQYGITMKKVFTGDVVSYTQSINVIDEVRRESADHLSLAIARG